MRRELLPNVALPVTVVAMIGMSRVIVIEGILSFLGLSVAPPTPTWGNMIALGDERTRLPSSHQLRAIRVMVITIFALNSVGNALRKTTDLRESPSRKRGLSGFRPMSTSIVDFAGLSALHIAFLSYRCSPHHVHL